MSRLSLVVSLLALSFAPLACQINVGSESSSGIPTTGFETSGTSLTGSETGESTSMSTTSSSTTSSEGETETDTDTAGEDNDYCVHQCEADDDCLINGMDAGLSCVDSFCLADTDVSCTTDDECVALLSGWSSGAPCTSGGGECEAAMQICLDIEGEGHCALAPSDFIECADAGMEEIPTTDIDGAPVVVCGRPEAACHPDAYCFLPCASDLDCSSAAYPACNPTTGLCECSSDADCQTIGSPQFGTCNQGICGCSSDGDCLAAGVGDICNSFGACGCTDDAACSGVDNPYDGGMVECVAY